MRYFLLLCLCLCFFMPSQAQEAITSVSICGLTFVNDSDADTLSVLSADGSIASSYEVVHYYDPYYDLEESADCRFVIGYLNLRNGSDLPLVVWDGQTGQEFGQASYSDYAWSPDNQRLLLESRGGVYLWDFMSDTIHTISTENINIYHPHTIWSPSRGLLFHWQTAHNRAILPNEETVRAYNWLTGEVVAEYTNLASVDIETSAELSANERYLIVYSLHSYPEYQGITVYDLETGATWMLDSGTEEFINYNSQIEISPDGRYLVAANRYLWVWDLSLMTDSSIEYSPVVYYGSEAWVESFVFISPTVIEVMDSGETVSRWDISNGEPVP